MVKKNGRAQKPHIPDHNVSLMGKRNGKHQRGRTTSQEQTEKTPKPDHRATQHARDPEPIECSRHMCASKCSPYHKNRKALTKSNSDSLTTTSGPLLLETRSRVLFAHPHQFVETIYESPTGQSFPKKQQMRRFALPAQQPLPQHSVPFSTTHDSHRNISETISCDVDAVSASITTITCCTQENEH